MMSRRVALLMAAGALASPVWGYQEPPPAAPTVISENVISERVTGTTVGEGVVVSGDAGMPGDGSTARIWETYPSRLRVQVDGTGMIIHGTNLAPVLTTSPFSTPRSRAGVIGQPGTTSLAGDDNRESLLALGGRLGILYYLDNFEDHGIEFIFQGVTGSDEIFSTASDGDPILARPFFNEETGLQDSQLIAFPGIIAGTFSMTAESTYINNELLARQAFTVRQNGRIDLLYGVRFMWFSDDLNISESVTPNTMGSALVPGTTLALSEDFNTDNYVFALQAGVSGHLYRGPFSLEAIGKVALGGVLQTTDVNGRTTVVVPGAGTANTNAGLFTDNTNIQSNTDRLTFGVIPEFALNLRYHLNTNLAARIGYTFIFIDPVTRPEDLIHLPSARPSLLTSNAPLGVRREPETYGDSEVWLMGLTAGIEYRY